MGEFRLGDLLVREQLVTEDQLATALRAQGVEGRYTPLGQVLVRQKVLTGRQLASVLKTYEKKPKLGDVLVRSGLVTHRQLEEALVRQKKTRERLGDILTQLGYVSDTSLRQAVAVQLDIPYIDLDRIILDKSLSRTVNRNYAGRHNLVPIASVGDTITVCLDDPTETAVIEELRRLTGRIVMVVTSSHDSIARGLTRLYERQEAPLPMSRTIQLLGDDLQNDPARSRMVEDNPSLKTADTIVRQLLATAIEHRASDIHIETLANRLQIRYRIDGMLEQRDIGEMQEACNRSAREVLSRLKILGRLDIAEKRRPQDGSFRIKVEREGEQTDIDLRLSVVPGYYGESAVLRLLDRKNAPGSISQLAFPKPIADRLHQLLERPTGIFLVTGPTGSGKSTTLYASLITVYRPHLRVLTAEDPIEYIYDQFSQSEVNHDIGNTFATYLRAFLRHDPEIIMVGEIRDEETADMAFRAAQTGHLLLSTLHTNTAIGVVPRLLDLKIDPNTLGSSVIGVLGQRLVRQVCRECKDEYQPTPELVREFFPSPPVTPFFKGHGCEKCHQTGYRGRRAVVELWVPGEEDIALINKRAPFDQIQASARSNTLSMADTAWECLQEGTTTLEELIRVLPYDAITEFRQRHDRESGTVN